MVFERGPKAKKKVPLSPAAAQKKQARINRALSKYTEFPEYPEHMYQRALDDLQLATGAIFELDKMIARTNALLHQAQGAYTGKISVRFKLAGGTGADRQNRVPNAVVWFGGDGPNIYKPVSERLTRVKLPKLKTNRLPVRRLLNHLQMLLDKREAMAMRVVDFSRSIKQSRDGITRAGVATNRIEAEIPNLLEVDFTKVI
ncbi:hypothetical protein [Noviherbaspirillum galbum]|uniref:Uncharacterized protein n=1 Tax=Noviherbaspirillum galbum TaxID=2709383 RepID=A0A6B3SL86_9BURK|nr:hypothetical protein [Noviherbaspirillum galbum]NEX60135.1 hypothetical protein [Noviherbaspirillum galbum]